ncbi:META domain-containing protein [Bacteroidaceae bacterium HV4-6-C5C]|nr:META domain-containing protein [Bacteroidaceae bacterium HV4-6-C5C]
MTKKTLISICMLALLISFSSCRSVKPIVSLDSINEEWYIIEMNGSVIVPSPGRSFPTIKFDTSNGEVLGSSGCNRFMGSFDVNSHLGSIELSKLISTRMACPDMTLENNLLLALGKVKKYKKVGTQIALCNTSNRPVLILQKVPLDITNPSVLKKK